MLLLEKIVEGLAMGVFGPRLRGASLFLYKDLGLEERAHVVRTLVGNAHFDGFDAFVPRRGIEVHAVAARVHVRSAVLALIGDLNLIHHLDFRRTVVAARHQDEFCLYASAGALGPRGWLWFSFPVTVHVTVLLILSRHLQSPKNSFAPEDLRADALHISHSTLRKSSAEFYRPAVLRRSMICRKRAWSPS